MTPSEKNTTWLRLTRKVANSRRLARLQEFAPIGWLVRRTVAVAAGLSMGRPTVGVSAYSQISGTGLDATLQRIVQDVVQGLGYAGAMVATYEKGDILPIRAFHVDPTLISLEDVHEWEERVNQQFMLKRTIFSDPNDPDIGKVYVYDDRFVENLSVQAVRARQPVIDDSLYSLFRPFAPIAAEEIISGVQAALAIRQVIAVPFFLGDDVMGNLFAAKRGLITEQDVRILSAFGNQAASAIENEQRQLQDERFQEFLLDIHRGLQDELAILDRIVKGIVHDLNYVGAMVATYETDGSMPLRAFYVEPTLVSMDKVREYEKLVTEGFMEKRVIFSDPTDPDIGRVYVNDPEYQDNLSVQAVKRGRPVISSSLYDLFKPIAPVAARETIQGLQDGLGIRQVIAVPFFLGDELIGNLFAGTLSRSFSKREIGLLQQFGQQAATGIRNARLYRQVEQLYERTEEQRRIAEERREVAQVFGKMAFSAAASVHRFRNHIGFVRGQLQLLPYIEQFGEQQRKEILQSTPKVMERLNIIVGILDQLHEPWRPVDDRPTDINNCLVQAKDKIAPAPSGITVTSDLTQDLPLIHASPDMMVEAFRIIIKNAFEAIQACHNSDGQLMLQTRLNDMGDLEIHIRDNGSGIKEEDLDNIFRLRWTTKEHGLGFGLFWTKDYIEGLGGQISVSSRWQEGSDFYIVLPIKQPVADEIPHTPL